MSELSTARYIRECVFRINTQSEFARLLAYTQATISRIESGDIDIGPEFQRRVRRLASERGIEWSDSLFFEVPSPPKRPTRRAEARVA